jgi:membrane associated rhomboid family serine protease
MVLGVVVNLIGWFMIDNAAHLFGFLVGAALTRLLLMLDRAAAPAVLALGLAALGLVGWAVWHVV